MAKKILIIGGGAAALSAAFSARREDAAAEITLVTDDPHTTYSRCGMPYFLEGKIKSLDSLIMNSQSYYNQFKIDFRTGTTAKKIIPKKKEVIVSSSSSKGDETLKYDSPVLALGARPNVLPIKGIEKKNVFTCWTLEDTRRISEAAKAAKNAVVCGARMTGLEIAAALSSQSISVTMLEALPDVMNGALDSGMASRVKSLLEEKNISVLTGTKLEGIDGKEKISSVLAGGKKIQCDLLVIAAGTTPNTELAKDAFIKLMPGGLIRVDESMQTSFPSVYAAGDCAFGFCSTPGANGKCPGALSSRMAGAIAGANAAGASAFAKPHLFPLVTRIFETEIASAGISEDAANKLGIKAVSHTLEGATHPHYYLKSSAAVKLIASEEGTIIGAQIIGDGAGLRINYCALAISKKLEVRDLAEETFAYCPATSDLSEPLISCAQALSKKLGR